MYNLAVKIISAGGSSGNNLAQTEKLFLTNTAVNNYSD